MSVIRIKSVVFLAFAFQMGALALQDLALTRAALAITFPLLMFVAAANWRMWGMRVMLAGAALNFAAIVANGGLMPVDIATVSRVDGPEAARSFAGSGVPGSKSVVLPEDEIAFAALADRFVVGLPAIGAKAVSAGDLIIGTGLLMAVGQAVWVSKPWACEGSQDE